MKKFIFLLFFAVCSSTTFGQSIYRPIVVDNDTEIRKEQSKIERQMLKEAYVEMPFDSDPVARALYNSGRYSQYAMTVSLTGGVLASLAAAENPPISLAITLLTAVTSIALNWKAGDELKKAGVYKRNQ